MRFAAAWVLIVVGLVPLIGGVGLLTSYALLDQAAGEERAAKARIYPNHPTARRPPNDPNSALEYSLAVSSVVAGFLLTGVGIWLRRPSDAPGAMPQESAIPEEDPSPLDPLSS